jgi:hypothetical protein
MTTGPADPDVPDDVDDVDDVALLGLLAEDLDDGEPAPTDLLRLAVDAAWQLRRIDAVVARLVADVTADAADVRGEPPGRFLTFALGDVTLELDLRPDGTTVVGQLLPAEQLAVTAVTGGETQTVPVDDLGRFRVVNGAPLLVLRVDTADGSFVTPPIRR